MFNETNITADHLLLYDSTADRISNINILQEELFPDGNCPNSNTSADEHQLDGLSYYHYRLYAASHCSLASEPDCSFSGNQLAIISQ
ncbi:hypothetical protein [Chitinophaga sp. 212800010-3]|uniref:hypothetical protein n=1 Tax=unclassified Chitinophaga TaxID=2619133 RepID=UPI002DEAF2C9|nr:hypothetical protein [Chitinophaga sp. 212800010-3]